MKINKEILEGYSANRNYWAISIALSMLVVFYYVFCWLSSESNIFSSFFLEVFSLVTGVEHNEINSVVSSIIQAIGFYIILTIMASIRFAVFKGKLKK